MKPKNRCRVRFKYAQRFFGIYKHLINLKISPLKQDLSKKPLSGSNHRQRFCDLWRYLMSLRASSGECETKKLLQSWASIRDSGFLVPGVSSTEQSRSSLPELINS